MIVALGRIFRSLIRTGLWAAVASIAVAMNVAVAVANYMGVVNAFDLLKYEPLPLSHDPLLGSLVGAFFGAATLAHFFAMTLAVTLAFTVFLISHLAVEVYQLNLDRRVYQTRRDSNSEDIATKKIRFNIVSMALLLLPLGVVFRWDLALFRFRSLAVALYPDATTAVAEMTAWGSIVHGTSAIIDLTAIGAWGYLGVTVLACAGLELALYTLGESFAMFTDSVANLFPSDAPHISKLVEAGQQASPPNDPPAEPIAQPTAEELLDEDESIVEPEVEPNAPRAGTTAPVADDARVEVIGRTGHTTTLAEALADHDRYHVHPTTGEVFDRQFWEQLQGDTANT